MKKMMKKTMKKDLLGRKKEKKTASRKWKDRAME